MNLSFGTIALAALSMLGVGGFLVTSGVRPDEEPDGPPGLSAGTKIYELQPTRDSRNVLTALAVTAPIEVLEVRDSWVRVKVPNMAYGPVWLNFDQVVYYRTTREER